MKSNHKLTNKDISEQYNGMEFYLMKGEVLGTFAKWVINQSPYDVPNITKAVKSYNEFLFDKFDKEDAVIKFTYKELSDYISEDNFGSIPEVEKLNNPKIDNGQRFSSSSRFHKTKADYDFIDLGALARNIFYEICREHITQPL